MAQLVFSTIIPSTGGVNINLEHATGTLVAPAQIWVEASDYDGLVAIERTGAIYDGPYHEYYHYWTIRGEPLPDFTAPQNLPPIWKRANRFKGKRACIPLTMPGDYIIDLMVVDKDGNKAVAATSTITVTAATDVYSEADRVYVDQSNTFTGVPAASGKVANMEALWSYLQANTRPHLVLLKRGDDYQEDEYLRVGSTRQMAHIDTWGTGAKPILRISTNPTHTYYSRAGYELYSITGVDQMSLSNVDIRGDWDSATETGCNGRASGIYLRPNSVQELFFTAYNVTVNGVGIGLDISPSGTGGNCHIATPNTYITSWRDYGCFAQNMVNGELSLAGTAIVQHEDALHGGTDRDGEGSSDGFLGNHGPIRMDQMGNLDLQKFDGFSRTGWSKGGNEHRADQPVLRFNTNGVADCRLHVSESVMEGGYQIVNIEGENSGTGDEPANIVMEDSLLLATAKQTSSMVACHQGGATFRNLIGFYPDVVLTGAPSTRGFLSLAPNNSVNDNADAPVSVYSNSVLNMLTAATDFGSNMSLVSVSTFNDYLEENNLYHFPNGTNPIAETDTVTIEVLDGLTPRFKGVRYGWLPIKIAIPSGGLLNGGTLSIPYTGIDKQLSNKVLESAGATDQAYWLTNGGPKHRIGSKNHSPHLTADTGGISVTFGTTEVTITNTSGKVFGASGGNTYVQLDRSEIIPPMDTTYASPSIVSVVRHTASLNYTGAQNGRKTLKDAFSVERKDVPSRGALNQI